MLVLAENPEELISSLIDDAGLRRIAMMRLSAPWVEALKEDRKLARKLKEPVPPAARVFTNEGKVKRCVAIQVGADFFIYAKSRGVYSRMMDDLYVPCVEPGVCFPDRHMRKYWDKWAKGRPYISLHAPFQAWKCGVEAGFKPVWHRRFDEKKKRRKMRRGDGSTWHVTGKPRFAKRVKHPCRVIEKSDELLPLILQGVEYGEHAKDYLRACLLLGPSFVCEVGGEPVCWSGTHLGGTMGMIYTPPEHRRKGYAESLTAFQIDHMLARDGIALAHVVLGNRASEKLLATFGAQHSTGSIAWRSLVWPYWKRKKLKG